jgi:hypothetical protein
MTDMHVNADGLKYGIDMSGEKFGAAVSIAHLALNSFEGIDSDDLIIYHAAKIVDRDWSWELEDFEYEYGLSYRATFKDGSKLTVCAWRMEPAEDQWEG